MPYKDPEKKKAHAKTYFAGYRVQNLAAIKDRQAQWFQQEKPQIIARQRRQRRTAKSVQAIAIVQQVAASLTE